MKARFMVQNNSLYRFTPHPLSPTEKQLRLYSCDTFEEKQITLLVLLMVVVGEQNN